LCDKCCNTDIYIPLSFDSWNVHFSRIASTKRWILQVIYRYTSPWISRTARFVNYQWERRSLGSLPNSASSRRELCWCKWTTSACRCAATWRWIKVQGSKVHWQCIGVYKVREPYRNHRYFIVIRKSQDASMPVRARGREQWWCVRQRPAACGLGLLRGDEWMIDEVARVQRRRREWIELNGTRLN